MGSPDASIEPDHFALVATGRFKGKAGKYELCALSDDGVRIWIDDKRVIDTWVKQSATQNVVKVELSSNSNIRVEYFEHTSNAVLAVWLVREDAPQSNAKTDTD